MNTEPADHITANDFEDKVMTSGVPVLIDFYRKSCHGCQQLAPTIDKLAQIFRREKSSIQVFKCDDDQLMRRVKIFFVPQLVLFLNGKDYWIERAIKTPEDIQKEIARILSSTDQSHS